MPIRAASSAFIRRPVKISSFALVLPTILGNSCVPPALHADESNVFFGSSPPSWVNCPCSRHLRDAPRYDAQSCLWEGKLGAGACQDMTIASSNTCNADQAAKFHLYLSGVHARGLQPAQRTADPQVARKRQLSAAAKCVPIHDCYRWHG